jgi:hypothetical protein
MYLKGYLVGAIFYPIGTLISAVNKPGVPKMLDNSIRIAAP